MLRIGERVQIDYRGAERRRDVGRAGIVDDEERRQCDQGAELP